MSSPLAFGLPLETSLALLVLGLLLFAWTALRQRRLSRRERAIVEIMNHLPGTVYRSRIRPDGSSHIEFLTSHRDLIGWDPKTLTHPSFDAIRVVHEDDRERVRAIARDIVMRQGSGHFEVRCLTPRGDSVWVRTGITVVPGTRNGIQIVGFAENVEESHRTREALERTRNRMALAMAAAHMGIWDWDIVRDAVIWSPEVYDLLGVPQGSFGGTYAAYLELVHPEDRTSVTASIQEALRSGKGSFAHENRVRHGSGRTLWVVSNGKVVRNDAGKPIRMVGAVVDVTARREAELALAEQRERLNFVLKGSQDGFWDWNIETGHVTFSDRWATMLGYAPEEIEPAASSWDERIHPDDRVRVWNALNAHLNGRADGYEVEHRLRTKEGEYRWILTRGLVVRRDDQGQALRIAGTHVDIDARKRAEEALASSEKRLLRAERIGHFGSFELDVVAGRLLVSPGFRAILGESEGPAERTRDAFLRSVHATDRAAVDTALASPPPAEERFRLAFRLITGDGARRHVQMEVEHAGANLLRGTIQDVTAERLAERQLVRYRDHLERLIRHRTRELERAQEALLEKERLATLGQLTATVGHELRNPLGTIRSTFFSIQERLGASTGGDLQHAVDRIERSILRCDRIIEELLDYTRSPTLELAERQLDAWLDELLVELEIPSEVRLRRERGASVPVTFDAERMRRCLVNLVTNAVQAMQEHGGDPVLTVATFQDAERTVIQVRDSGRGFSPTDQERALEPLYSTRSFGVGLGLTIVERIVREHGGRVILDNHAAGGAQVSLELPHEVAAG